MELLGGCQQEALLPSFREACKTGHCMLPWRLGAHQEGVRAANASAEVPHLGKTLPVSVSLLLKISSCIQALHFPHFSCSPCPVACHEHGESRHISHLSLQNMHSEQLDLIAPIQNYLTVPLITWLCYPWR